MSTTCVIIGTGRLIAAGKTALVLELVERLKAKGCEVAIMPHAEIIRKEEEAKKKICVSSAFGRFPEMKVEQLIRSFDEKGFEPCLLKRERDYPTLKQGLRDPKFRNKRR